MFAEGHAKVLLDYGVTKVTSSNNDWFFNPNVYVVLVLAEDGEVVGGERIHMVHKDYPLPIENAITIVDKKVHPLVASYAQKGLTGELCGLWNSKSIAGRGVSVLLTKLGVALAKILNMSSLFVLCAPYTVEMCQKAGFEIETSIGNNGTFIYPKLDLIATSLCIKDMADLKTADDAFKKQIFSFVENPIGSFIETGAKGEFNVDYDLAIKVN
jgi:hypothetical protein